MSARYLIRPRADQDPDDQAYYLATHASPDLGHRFLLAAHETFSLLATQPRMGWPCRVRHPALARLRFFRVSGFERVLVLYRPLRDGVEILRAVHGSRDLNAFLRGEEIE